MYCNEKNRYSIQKIKSFKISIDFVQNKKKRPKYSIGPLVRGNIVLVL